MKIIVLASGSKGNASVWESGGTRILIDAGISTRQLLRKLRACGSDGRLDAIVITHAHGDHVGLCVRIAQQLDVPVYVSESSTARLRDLERFVKLHRYSTREPFRIGRLTLSPLPVPHDVSQVALVVTDGRYSAAIATDLGEVPPDLPEHIAHCDVLLVESNHDVEMLQRGPDPPKVKQRNLSKHGHLSNEQTHALLRSLPDRFHTVVLMHLSRTNNRPDIALEVASDALAGRQVRLFAAAQDDTLVLDARAPRPPSLVVGKARKSGTSRKNARATSKNSKR